MSRGRTAHHHDRALELARAITSLLDSRDPADLAQVIARVLKPEDIEDVARLARDLAEALSGHLKLSTKSVGDLEALLKEFAHTRHTAEGEELLTVVDASHYHALREAVSMNTFQRVEESPWPTAVLSRGETLGQAQLRPPALDEQPHLPLEELEPWERMMWRQREELSDLDADVLDALSAIWLSHVRTPDDDAMTTVDELLAMRGLKPKRGGGGRRGGFELQQRRELLRALSHIQNLWITMAEVEVAEEGKGRRRKPSKQTVQSRAFVITDRMGQLRLDGHMDTRKFVFRPGKVFAHFLFGPGRQTALLSAKALHYDPYHQLQEKRLTRYLSWMWKREGSTGPRPYEVAELMDAVGGTLDARRPNRTRERLERALETLHGDRVIASWQYDDWEERMTERHGWAKEWLRASIIIEPPESVQKLYQAVVQEPAPPPRALPEHGSLGERIRSVRLQRDLSQAEAASQLGISQAHLSNLERNKVTPSSRLQEPMKAWLEGPPERL